jgi:acetoacetyl-CoA synthetase
MSPRIASSSQLATSDETPLFQPSDPEQSATIRFLQQVNAVHGLNLRSYFDLYKWSAAHLDAFWGMVWDATNVIGEKGAHIVDNGALPSANPVWCAHSEAAINKSPLANPDLVQVRRGSR